MAAEQKIIDELREIRGLLDVLVRHLPPAALEEARQVYLEQQWREISSQAHLNPKRLTEFLENNPGWRA